MARTVLIVDHPSFRTSARRVLEAAGYEVVGEAEDGGSALAAARALRPALVLLDVQLPDINGFEVAAMLTGEDDSPTVVLTSSRDGSDFAGMVGRSGARGFLPKHELSGPALEALLAVSGLRRALIALGAAALAMGLITIPLVLESRCRSRTTLGLMLWRSAGRSSAGLSREVAGPPVS